VRILQCVDSIDPARGGSVEAARLLTAALGRLGHTVEIVTLFPPEAEWAGNWQAKIHCAGAPLGYYGYCTKLVDWLTKQAGAFDVFIVHGVWRYMSVAVWRASRARKIPYVLYTHGMLDPFFNRFAWKRLKKTIHWRALEHRVLRDAAAVIFTCEAERAAASRNFQPFICNPVLLNLGIEGPATRGDAPRFPAELNDKQVLFYLGRFDRQKGCDTLIAAFARVAAAYPDVRLLMAGPDPAGWKTDLVRLAQSLGVSSQIVWHGPVFGPAKWEFFRRADAYIMPTNFENFGIAIVEALACGLPVLISSRAAVAGQVAASGAGFVSPNTVEGTTELLEKWLTAPESMRAQMRANALRCFREHFAIDAVAASLSELLQSVAERPYSTMKAHCEN
jgi:glycosyltransferase involved in cell wall biosynthesis